MSSNQIVNLGLQSDQEIRTGVPGENHISTASHWQTLSQNVVSSTPCHYINGIKIHNVSGDSHW